MFAPLIVFSVTLLVGISLIATQSWHGHFSLDGLDGIQKHHTQPTPRIGGVAIALGLVVGWWLSSTAEHAILGPMLLAGIPALHLAWPKMFRNGWVCCRAYWPPCSAVRWPGT